jgi:cobalt/nickel transport system ATP-binding protein
VNRPLLELRKVEFSHADRKVLRGLDFALHSGERVALTGPNGAGKTTMLHLMVGLQRPNAGQVLALGQERRVEADFVPVRRRVGLLFQDSDDQLFCPTVLEDVAFGPLNIGRSPEQARADAEQTLSALGLDGFQDFVGHRLSAGEKRLVALASVLAMRPEALLLDEPTNGLDVTTEQRLVEYLQESTHAMVLVSHDQRVTSRLTTRTCRLEGGRLSWI